MQIFSASQILPVSSPPISGGAIAVRDGRIAAVGTVEELKASCGGPVTDFPGCTIMPGLVNAHTHLELTHFPSWKVRKDLDYLPKSYVQWVSQLVKIRRALSREELEHSVHEGIRLCIESGTTTIGEILTDFSLLPLYASSPLGGRYFLEGIGHDPRGCAEVLKRMEESLQKPAGKFLPGLSPHAPHTVSGTLFTGMHELSCRYEARKAIHLSESREEVSFMHDSTGDFASILYPAAHWEEYLPSPRRTTSTAWLDSLGVLDRATAAIHCVHLTPADGAILRERGCFVVLCPRSNDRLNVGCAPHHLLKRLGLPLAIGTDSLASNDSISLWDEMRYLRALAPDDFSAAELLEMATLGGARALGLQDAVGSLQVGKRADFLVLSHRSCEGCSLHQALLEASRLEEVYISGAAFSPLS
ncbi:amidohydrolase family protein [Geomonas sp. RF6]|uniref:amidohydrolase family protein n=1 Tax=Geomonas sp. RF6 TaxID=2897342 RepID=UPI001E3C8D7A|nr:amidohydrolase family protein [Geomonas sp. RF6]UFS71192.1 amidohydrolase family protein [Geomonas sp. RF6]